MPPFKPFIISTWSVLDYIKQENNTSHPITDYPDFVHWIIKKEVPKGEQIPPLISEWISLCTTTEHFATLDSLRLEQELMEKTNYRAFRTASATYPTPTDNDSRVSDLIRFMISKPKLKFTWTCLLNHFFSNREGLERREVYKGVFFTRPSTHFQQLMFLSVVLQLKNTVGKSRGRNNGFTLTPNNGQRIGWALQTVMRGWDSFAKFLNFKNIEQMILPYISICNESIHIFVLHSRDLGYLPIKYQSSFEFPLTPTTVASETFNYAAEQDDEVDAQLRILASLFLEDCIGTVSNADLYTLSSTGSWPLINRFQVEGNDLPTRFHQLPKEEINKMKLAVQRFQLQQTGSTPVIAPSRVKIEDAPISETPHHPGTTITYQVGSSSTTMKRNPPSISSDEDFQPERKMRKTNSQEHLSDLLEPMEEFMSPFAKLYCCSFEQLQGVHKVMGLEDLTNSVQLLLTDPPYNIRRNRGMEDSAYDMLSFEQMKQVSNTAAAMLRKGGHGIIFCSHDQFPLWVDALSIPQLSLNPNRAPVQMFSIDPTPLHIVRHPNHFSTNPGRTSCTLVGTVEYAVHFKKNGLTYTKEAQMVNYKSFNYVKSSFQGFRNTIDKVKGLLPGEQVRMPTTNENKSKALRNEQKPLALLKELICRFSQPEDTVVDLFSGTFSTAVACFQLSNRRRFVGCEQDMNCFEIARDFCTKKFAEVISEGRNGITASLSIQTIAKELTKRKLLKHVGDPDWTAPKGLPSFQLFPPQLMRFISAMCKDVSLFTNCAVLPLHSWASRYQSFMEQLDVADLLNYELACRGLVLSPNISDNSNMYCFTTRSFQPGDVVCHCYGTLVYYDLDKRVATKKNYEEGILQLNQETFSSYAIGIEVHGKRFQEAERTCKNMKVSLVPAPFCPVRHIYNFDYSQGSSSTAPSHEPNVSLFQTSTNLNQPSKLLPYNLFEVRATRSINSGVMLVIDNKPSKKKQTVSEIIELD